MWKEKHIHISGTFANHKIHLDTPANEFVIKNFSPSWLETSFNPYTTGSLNNPCECFLCGGEIGGMCQMKATTDIYLNPADSQPVEVIESTDIVIYYQQNNNIDFSKYFNNRSRELTNLIDSINSHLDDMDTVG